MDRRRTLLRYSAVIVNFAAGFAYVAAAADLPLRTRWGRGLPPRFAVATVLAYAAFGAHVAAGGAYERRTFAATAIRSAFWIAIAVPRLAPKRTGGQDH